MWDEWLNSIKTRLSAKGKVIVIMTRWHEDDLGGRIIANEENVTIVNLPVEAEVNDPLGRKIGEALAPEIGKDNAWLADFKQGYISKEGSRTWNALFMGKPTAEEGNLFKREWWKFYEKLPDKLDRMYMSVDAAFKDEETSDFVVCQVWGMCNIDCYLIDQVRARMDFPTTLSAIESLKAKHPKITRIFIEDKANGSAIIQILSKKISGIIAVEPEGGKVARANAVTPHIESGHVWLPKFGAFTGDVLEECSAFPNGTHDDIVDALSQAINRMMYYSTRESKTLDYVVGGTYTIGELKLKGFTDTQISGIIKAGNVRIIGGRKNGKM